MLLPISASFNFGLRRVKNVAKPSFEEKCFLDFV